MNVRPVILLSILAVMSTLFQKLVYPTITKLIAVLMESIASKDKVATFKMLK